MIKIRFFEEKESTRHHRLKFKVQFLIEVSHDDQQFFINNNNKKFTRNARFVRVSKKKCYITFFFKADNTFKRNCTSSTHQPTTQPGLKDKKKASHHAQETT
jgi:hypothetical protein